MSDSVDAAHPVDRHVLYEQVLLDRRLLLRDDLFHLGLDDWIRHGSPFDDEGGT